MTIRNAAIEDLDSIYEVEKQCFPSQEAASKEEFAERLKFYSDHFWLMFEGERLISFVDGFVTDEKDLTDEMYAKANLHNKNGKWQMIFGVNTIPEKRKKGYASKLLKRAIEDAKKQGRTGVVLTCKEGLIDYYSTLGFENEGITDKSTHGNVEWYQMRIVF